jgi:hypothetical protein
MRSARRPVIRPMAESMARQSVPRVRLTFNRPRRRRRSHRTTCCSRASPPHWGWLFHPKQRASGITPTGLQTGLAVAAGPPVDRASAIPSLATELKPRRQDSDLLTALPISARGFSCPLVAA